MATLDEYNQLKKKVDAAQQKADKAAGALEQIMKTLKSEFGCKTLNEAKKKLKQLKIKSVSIETELLEAIKTFEEKWDESLE